MLGVVFPDVHPLGNLAQQLGLEHGRGARQDRLEGALDGLASVAAKQLGDPLCAHAAGSHFGVQVAAQAVGQARVAHHHTQQIGVGLACRIQSDRRDDQALLKEGRAVAGHRAWYAAADVVVVAEGLHEGDDLAVVVDGHGDAQVGQVPDPALGLVDVVVEEDVAGLDGRDREIAHDRLYQGRVRPSGQLAAVPVVDASAKVARLTDHRRARGPLDRRLDLRLRRG